MQIAPPIHYGFMSHTTPMRILVLNAGSSTLKFALYVDSKKIAADTITIGQEKTMEHALLSIIESQSTGSMSAVAHRVVHGGASLQSPTQITLDTLEELKSTVHLAPLHQLPAVQAIECSMRRLPKAVHVACFDTAFHSTLPLEEILLPLPRSLFQEGIRRYGFHGLSYESIVSQLASVSKRASSGRTVICHLGSGCSLCGVIAGASNYTTMSFTPQDGLIMGTRPGRIDSGILLHLLRKGYSLEQLEQMLTKQSGLLGLSNLSSDMRMLLKSSASNLEARQAIELFCRCVAREITAAATAIGGLDSIVFTAGIGENCPSIRESIIEKLSWLNIQIDSAANLQGHTKLHSASSHVEIFRLNTDEQAVMERHAHRFVEDSLRE